MLLGETAGLSHSITGEIKCKHQHTIHHSIQVTQSFHLTHTVHIEVSEPFARETGYEVHESISEIKFNDHFYTATLDSIKGEVGSNAKFNKPQLDLDQALKAATRKLANIDLDYVFHVILSMDKSVLTKKLHANYLK